MSSKLKNKRKQKNTIWFKGRQFMGSLLDVLICVYMLLVIVVMPFYNEEGFVHIGTDKATFFRQISVIGACVILPSVVIYLIFSAIESIKQRGKNDASYMQRAKEQCIKLWKSFKTKLSITDKFALLYGIAVILSYLLSSYKETAFWGTTGWFMGMFPQLTIVAIYFLVSRLWQRRKWVPMLFLPVSAIVFVLGYLNRFGIFPIDMKVTNVQFISTIGNINWYCGYLVSVFFGGYYLLWQSDLWNTDKKSWKKILLMVYVAVGFATLLTQGSMSGLFALAVMLLVTFCLSAGDGKRMLLFWQETLLLSLMSLFTFVVRTVLQGEITYTDGVVDLLTYSVFPVIATVVSAAFVSGLVYCGKQGRYPDKIFRVLAKILMVGCVGMIFLLAGMIVLNTLRPGSLGSLSEYALFTFSPRWGSNRATTWKAGIMCFAEQDFVHKLVGVGPDSMSAFLYQDGSDGLRQMVIGLFGNSALTNAHNEWITVLVNTGLLGCVGFVGMMVSAIVRYIKYGVVSHKVIIGACGFCLLAYSLNNMFSFQQSMSVATIFVILGIGEAYAKACASVYCGKKREE